ncbi:MAG TPA: recombinase family protein [Bacillota bacterium]|nr:recombinase family protein [Bacillota bacterium]
MKRMTAIYARVSSDHQKEEGTIASQRAALLEYAQAHELSVPAQWVFEDEGYSGTVLARPALERLRDLVAEGQVEVVLVYAPDRLSRRYAHQVVLLEEFHRRGVETLFVKAIVPQTPEEHLLVQFQGMIAEYERAQITERTRRGRRHRAKAGAVSALGTAAYGYRYVRKTEHSQAYLAIEESQAQVVRRVFEFYTQEQWSIAQIVRHLNAQAIPTQSGKAPWYVSTVGGMLRNSAYQGRAYFGKGRNCPPQKMSKRLRQKGGFSPRRESRERLDPSQWIPIAVPAIVSPEVFALAQERLDQNKRLSRRNTKEVSLLQGLLVCQQCGYAFYRSSSGGAKGAGYYRCPGTDTARHVAGPVCSARMLRVDYLDPLVWEQILELLRSPQLIQAELERRRQESRQLHPQEQRQEQLQRELSRCRQKMDKLLDAYQEELVSLSELRQRMPQLRKQLGATEQELQALALRTTEDQHWSQIHDSLEGFLARLNQNAQNLAPEERQKLVRLLVKQIDVGPDTVTIHHVIPLQQGSVTQQGESSPLCTSDLVTLSRLKTLSAVGEKEENGG